MAAKVEPTTIAIAGVGPFATRMPVFPNHRLGRASSQLDSCHRALKLWLTGADGVASYYAWSLSIIPSPTLMATRRHLCRLRLAAIATVVVAGIYHYS